MAASNRLPRLLIIGAMKSGTTTLYMDLVDSLGVYLAENKEPHTLCDDRVLTSEGRAEYAEIYARAAPDQPLCDASTGYTKLPDLPGVVDRAVQVLPGDFRVIYVVRDPVERALSHFRHEYVAGVVGQSADDDIRQNEQFLNYSRYAMQLRPWLDAIGPDRIKVVTLERYVSDRQSVLSELAEFTGTTLKGRSATPPKAYNQSKNNPELNGRWGAFQQSAAYRYLIRPLIPLRLRLKLTQLVTTKADLTKIEVQPETIEWLRAELSADTAELAEMLGQPPLWPETAAAALRST